ncbi:MAG: phosphoenolpyruvate synthase [Gammaproteobacteria bacterium]|nr:phosphoenolpyruvate synthase [Gammaproteobacteria bacterium]
MADKIIWFEKLGMQDVPTVGGKNASLGEMYGALSKKGVKIPNGFATTADAYREFLSQHDLDKRIAKLLSGLDVNSVTKLNRAGGKIRRLIMAQRLSPEFGKEIIEAWKTLSQGGKKEVAVRSSATAEDLPEASFAGQQETYLNVRNSKELCLAIKRVFASLYTNRAIAYRVHHGFAHEKVALSAGIQLMVRSDLGSSGVMFTVDTESGFSNAVFITANFGLGETVVQGAVNPDEYYLFKPGLENNKKSLLTKKLGSKSIKMVYGKRGTKIVKAKRRDQERFVLTEKEAEVLGKYALAIESHYQKAMDIEWAKDGKTGELFIVQARPETVKSREHKPIVEQYLLQEKGRILAEGRSIGQKIGQGKARVLASIAEMNRVKPGDVLITDMTDPDWEPIMKKASAIVTNRGGRTCHAAIVARELGVPAVVGCGDATSHIPDGIDVTVSCAEGDNGFVYQDLLKFQHKKIAIDKMPELKTEIMLNVANPEQAFAVSAIPNFGVGLARLEFIINDMIGVHPNAVLNFATLPKKIQKEIAERSAGYSDPTEFYVGRLAEGMAMIAAAFYPKPVIFRASDFKSNEYANLLGGELYEPQEENPMIGFRGASRYVHKNFAKAFSLECRAIKRVREQMGLSNVEVMIPFVRTVAELENVLQVMKKNGLERGRNGLRVVMMCEIPSNVILAEEFLEHVDGFSIGSNDLTQLTLGLDRDSSLVADLFDERNEAVKRMLEKVIKTCNKLDKYVGICGQAPSDYPELAKWLSDVGIKTMSLNPDSVVKTWLYLGKE